MVKTDKEDIEESIKEFHSFWLTHGKPHPASNEYLRLNRVFFYGKGVMHGIEVANEINDSITRLLGED